MVFSKYGQILTEEWERTPALRPYVALGESVIMPNHFHGLIGLSPLMTARDDNSPKRSITKSVDREKQIQPDSLNSTVGALKSAVTKRVNLLRGTPGAPFWQLGFHDHVVRDVQEFEDITSYIAFNPLNRHLDRHNPDFQAVESDVREWKYERGL